MQLVHASVVTYVYSVMERLLPIFPLGHSQSHHKIYYQNSVEDIGK